MKYGKDHYIMFLFSHIMTIFCCTRLLLLVKISTQSFDDGLKGYFCRLCSSILVKAILPVGVERERGRERERERERERGGPR